MAETLKPCPFCGGPAHVGSHSTGFSCGCDNQNCPVNPEYGDCQQRQIAIEGWNKRAPSTE